MEISFQTRFVFESTKYLCIIQHYNFDLSYSFGLIPFKREFWIIEVRLDLAEATKVLKYS